MALNFPNSPTNGQTYTTDAGVKYYYDSANTSWLTTYVAIPDVIYYENSTEITTNYTITVGKNAMTAGPITINSGVTVTVPSGSAWTIV